MSSLKQEIIWLDCIDSTNNYAMRIIDGNTAQHGTTVVARSQTAGKGQRGRKWIDEPGNSILMSVVVVPKHSLSSQFAFNASVTAAIVKVLRNLGYPWQICIKWPNDIIVNDKKAGGILIENVLRGSNWAFSVIGLGLNVNQPVMPYDLPSATSLRSVSGAVYDIETLAGEISRAVVNSCDELMTEEEALLRFNELLYKQGQLQSFTGGGSSWQAKVLRALPDGTLEVQEKDGAITRYTHGPVSWEYDFAG